VQGVERQDRKLLDAAALVGHLVPEGSMFAFLAAHRGKVFPDQEFADLFPSGRGRPSLPAPVAASILTLQTLHDLSDAETAEAARCDLRWKVATGMALDDAGFHPSTLTYWRQRLARSDRPHRINEAVKRVVDYCGSQAAGGGFHDPGGCGGDPGHRHPVGLGDPPGGSGGARRRGADRRGVHRA
jgi:transposase